MNNINFTFIYSVFWFCCCLRKKYLSFTTQACTWFPNSGKILKQFDSLMQSELNMHCLKRKIVKNFVHKLAISKVLVVYYFVTVAWNLEMWCEVLYCLSCGRYMFHSTKPFIRITEASWKKISCFGNFPHCITDC